MCTFHIHKHTHTHTCRRPVIESSESEWRYLWISRTWKACVECSLHSRGVSVAVCCCFCCFFLSSMSRCAAMCECACEVLLIQKILISRNSDSNYIIYINPLMCEWARMCACMIDKREVVYKICVYLDIYSQFNADIPALFVYLSSTFTNSSRKCFAIEHFCGYFRLFLSLIEIYCVRCRSHK